MGKAQDAILIRIYLFRSYPVLVAVRNDNQSSASRLYCAYQCLRMHVIKAGEDWINIFTFYEEYPVHRINSLWNYRVFWVLKLFILTADNVTFQMFEGNTLWVAWFRCCFISYADITWFLWGVRTRPWMAYPASRIAPTLEQQQKMVILVNNNAQR